VWWWHRRCHRACRGGVAMMVEVARCGGGIVVVVHVGCGDDDEMSSSLSWL